MPPHCPLELRHEATRCVSPHPRPPTHLLVPSFPHSRSFVQERVLACQRLESELAVGLPGGRPFPLRRDSSHWPKAFPDPQRGEGPKSARRPLPAAPPGLGLLCLSGQRSC